MGKRIRAKHKKTRRNVMSLQKNKALPETHKISSARSRKAKLKKANRGC